MDLGSKKESTSTSVSINNDAEVESGRGKVAVIYCHFCGTTGHDNYSCSYGMLL